MITISQVTSYLNETLADQSDLLTSCSLHVGRDGVTALIEHEVREAVGELTGDVLRSIC